MYTRVPKEEICVEKVSKYIARNDYFVVMSWSIYK